MIFHAFIDNKLSRFLKFFYFQCKEKCGWGCEHLECTKRCCEPCDREICTHPSKELIKKCSHQSIGVCGEPAPQLCRICQKEKFAELLFFGTEDVENARFIELADCHHIIEVKPLIQWMSIDQNDGSIQQKKCPRCTALIRHTKSLNKYIQASVRDIQAIKIKTFGDHHENMEMRNRLETKLKDVLNSQSFGNDPLRVRDIYIETRNSLSESNKCTQLALIEISNKINLLEKLQNICATYV